MLNYGRSKQFNSTKSIGSLATSSATAKAEATALGKNRGQPVRHMNMSPYQTKTRAIHRGSTAGLKNEKIVRLSANNTGYENPSNQNARNRVKQAKTIQLPKTNGIIKNVNNSKNNNFDMRLTSDKNSSVSKLNRKTGKG